LEFLIFRNFAATNSETFNLSQAELVVLYSFNIPVKC
jgi:hypothetical protein